MIIACDLDRTLIPNGDWPDDKSLEKFYSLVENNPNIILVYVSGRNLNLYEEAITDFGIKTPDYFLGSVGTEVYVKNGNKLIPDPDWDFYIKNKHPYWNRAEIVHIVSENIIYPKDFYLQEKEVQNKYKISYYLENEDLKSEILGIIKNYLLNQNIDAKVIYSFDPVKNIGLIDILPSNATKLGALKFVVAKLNLKKEDLIFCGDSGNDLLPIGDGIKSILVKNAPKDIKKRALQISKGDNLYIARGSEDGNGFYASGVIEGLKHFGVFK